MTASEAGYEFVQSMIPRADDKANLMWHGWALREAFVAGAEWQETRGPDRIEQLEAALYRIKQWADAYPPSVFPPVDEQYAQKAHEVLTANGMTLDRLSADAMRHVVQGVGKIAREALTK
jgi:hypothetical protein